MVSSIFSTNFQYQALVNGLGILEIATAAPTPHFEAVRVGVGVGVESSNVLAFRLELPANASGRLRLHGTSSRLQWSQLKSTRQLHNSTPLSSLSKQSKLIGRCDNAVAMEHQPKVHKSFAAAKLRPKDTNSRSGSCSFGELPI
jgi:hypothetical protein